MIMVIFTGFTDNALFKSILIYILWNVVDKFNKCT
jgi:hypothetical protein